jgi:hypothetical protein
MVASTQNQLNSYASDMLLFHHRTVTNKNRNDQYMVSFQDPNMFRPAYGYKTVDHRASGSVTVICSTNINIKIEKCCRDRGSVLFRFWKLELLQSTTKRDRDFEEQAA